MSQRFFVLFLATLQQFELEPRWSACLWRQRFGEAILTVPLSNEDEISLRGQIMMQCNMSPSRTLQMGEVDQITDVHFERRRISIMDVPVDFERP
jgi:hypothetical protein